MTFIDGPTITKRHNGAGWCDDDDDDETWIYIAHRHKISNALNTLVLRQKECLQHLFEGRFCTAGISDIVRQQGVQLLSKQIRLQLPRERVQ